MAELGEVKEWQDGLGEGWKEDTGHEEEDWKEAERQATDW